MKRLIKTLGVTMLVGLLLSAALVAGVVACAGAPDPTFIEINGEPIAHLGAGHWLVAVGAMSLALLIVLVVVPVVVLVPLAIVALVLVGVLLAALGAVAGVAALVFSPLILLGGVVWLILRLLRGKAPKNTARADATISG